MDMDLSIDDRQEEAAGWRVIRYVYRAPLLLAHLVITLPLTLLVIVPLGRSLTWGGETLTQHMIRWWSGALCRIFGMRLNPIGRPAPNPVMLLANHVCWMDIELLHSQRAAAFVAKAEIARWPLVGLLARAGDTVFHARGSAESREAVSDQLAQRLGSGRSVAIFPEGRTGGGEEVLPFHGRLLKAAVETGAPVQPVALAYLRGGRLVNREVSFRSGEHFVGNFFRLLGDPPLQVDIVFGAPIDPHGHGRRELAWMARESVVEALDERDAG